MLITLAPVLGVLAGVVGALAAGAGGAADASLLCYPVYDCLVNWALALLIRVRRVALGASPALSSAYL
jgi:hypothetical protein